MCSELGTKRPHLLSIKETELIKHYRNNYPFSCLLLYAISIILDRPFSAIKRKWTEEESTFLIDSFLCSLLS
jgi:hypothetical protein